MNIRVPNNEENKKVIKFLNKVFHKPFPSLIPSLYGKDKNTMQYHYVVEKEGVLSGAICAYPEDITLGGVTINGVAIGMVATAKKARNQGIMGMMLRRSEEAYKDSADVMFLTGRRHRYEHFGYYPAGATYCFEISSVSIKKWEKDNPYVIVRAKTEEDFLEVNELSSKRNMVVDRPRASESDVIRNWFSKLYLVKKKGRTVGYASGKFFKGYELECLYVEGGTLDCIQAVKAYKDCVKAPVLKVQVLPTEKVYKEAMSLCSEEYVVTSHEKYKVLSYKRLIEKLIAATLSEGKTLSYEGVLEIGGREKLEIVAKDGEFAVRETDKEPTLTISEKDAIASLLGQEESIIPGLQKISLRHSDFI
ncbi:MAG: GNAT family N-acetyltransferase [Clostridia bacterium]|nr:GNAT family N-acetyltransferase [Clostridia bacterium]